MVWNLKFSSAIVWVIVTHLWNDSGVWIDTSIWVD